MRIRRAVSFGAGAIFSFTFASTILLSVSPASAHEAHQVNPSGEHPQVLANGQNHGPFLAGESCGGAPSAYGIETAHHGPDAGISGKADGDGCYKVDGSAPGSDITNPVIF